MTTIVYLIQDDKEHLDDGNYYGVGIYNAFTREVEERLYSTDEMVAEKLAEQKARANGWKIVDIEYLEMIDDLAAAFNMVGSELLEFLAYERNRYLMTKACHTCGRGAYELVERFPEQMHNRGLYVYECDRCENVMEIQIH